MIKKVVLLLLLCLGFNAYAQKTINNYQYVIVPLTYDFLGEKDQYRLNTLTRYLFKQKGFTVLFDEEQFPDDLLNDPCKALSADVEKNKGGFLATRLEIILKDCYGKEILRSKVGISRVKDFKKSYTEALRRAFDSFEISQYKYVPIEPGTKESGAEIENALPKEAPAKEAKSETAKTEETVEHSNEDEVIADEELEEEDEFVEVVVEQTKESREETTLYAQEKNYGYQLVDTEPKVIMQLFRTSAKNVFIVKGKNAIVYKEDGFWYYSENDGELKAAKRLDIKF